MAVSMLEEMDTKGVTIGTIHADNDSSTIARAQSKFKGLKKKSDKNHIKKGFSKALYELSKRHKTLKNKNVIPYIVRCFMYAVTQNSSNPEKLKETLAKIVPHMYGDHSDCEETEWCSYRKNPQNYR